MDLSQLPVAWANYISIAGFLFLGGMVWLIPKSLIYTEAKDQSRWRDIRLWDILSILSIWSIQLL